MPITKIGSFFLLILRCAASCAVFALLVSSTVMGQASSASPTFETLAARAGSAREAGQTDEAIRNYRAALELSPSWDEGWWYLGTLLYDSDHFAEAIPALRHVVALQPNAAPAWALLGLSEFETGDFQDALVSLTTARKIGFADDPDLEKVALYHLGLLLNLNGDFEAATELLAGAFGPSHFTDQIKSALGLALLRVPILTTQVDPSKDALVHAAGETAVLLANHQSDAAARNLQQMLRDFPDTPYLHYQYGMTLAESSQFPHAQLEFREEIKISPDSAVVYLALAKVLQAQNQREDSAAASKRAEELAQHSSRTEAEQVSRYALNRGAGGTQSLLVNATPTGAASAVSFDEAAQRAAAELRAGRLEQAAAAYQSALNLRASWAEGWRQLGTIAYMRAQYPAAIAALQQAATLDTKQPDTWTLLGLSEFETKDYKNSLVHLERGRALGFSGNAAAVRISRYHLALLLNRSGDFDRAIDLLIPESGSGALAEEIQFAQGIALLRIPALPEEVPADQVALVRKAGEAAGFLSESRYDKAFPILEALLREYPNTRFLHYAYGDALASTSLYDEAQVQLREETRLHPESALPYLRLASIALQQHHSAAALDDAKKAVALSPESSEAHYLLGRSFLEEGDTPAATRELETARRYAPNSPKVHFNLARAYSRSDRGVEAQQERAEFERLNALLPGQQKSYGERAPSSRGEKDQPDQ